MEFEGAASGKVILLGEHAVVYNIPALAVSIGAGARAIVHPAQQPSLHLRDSNGPWDIEPSSDLCHAYRVLSDAVGVAAYAQATIVVPTRAGLGSSACLGVALSHAMLRLRRYLHDKNFDNEDVVRAATQWEQVFHGNPSGIDVAVAAFGGCIEFQRSTGVKHLEVPSSIPLCVGDTGLRSATRTMVELVANTLASRPKEKHALLNTVGDCVARARDALLGADWHSLAEAMNDNQQVLRTLGLDNPASKRLCELAINHGALACKITGAGGGGCVIALAPNQQQTVLNAWKGAGFIGFAVNAGRPRMTINESHATET
ncbi:MAG: mevalonate kinase [Sorangium cellulosum]|nr:MAG: mevalonate kinase [Sorangium cellulosum]